ncbi:cupin domain-containing protein [Achromobacter xylosoxidans]|uniref:cupin domain-containing protein n=1 Tax=Alcaligenes xylosoxydans xylosoxydans TaxID=85698 RepID=UPI001F12D7C0|nr:cupin domain-containing protein [Achromobacter xylosoxidans]
MSTITKIGSAAAVAGALLGLPAHAASPHAGAGSAPQPVVTELMSKDLPGIPGKAGLMLLVDYPPGAADPIHRHDASAFVYVLEGSIIMQVKGGQEVTLTPGQTFFEGPDDIHTVGRNASQTKPAKFVVVLVKAQGAPALIPVQ